MSNKIRRKVWRY